VTALTRASVARSEASNLYRGDRYVHLHPTLHEEDAPWKIAQVLPLVDRLAGRFGPGPVRVLDVGGGAGSILKAVAEHVSRRHGLGVRKHALDLSPGMLAMQRRRNPDLRAALNQDIRHTSIAEKQIDLTLMIDVLEHVPNPPAALAELRRISRFVIFKVPLEDNGSFRLWNRFNGDRPRQRLIHQLGHVNMYTFGRLKREIETHLGPILAVRHTDVFSFLLGRGNGPNNRTVRQKLRNLLGKLTWAVSPEVSSMLFSNFVMMAVKCR